MSTNEGRAGYSVDIDIGATSEQTAAIQRLFDDIGLEATVSATYTVKSPAIVAAMYLISSGAAAAFLKASGRFGENVGGSTVTGTVVVTAYRQVLAGFSPAVLCPRCPG